MAVRNRHARFIQSKYLALSINRHCKALICQSVYLAGTQRAGIDTHIIDQAGPAAACVFGTFADQQCSHVVNRTVSFSFLRKRLIVNKTKLIFQPSELDASIS